MEFFGQLGIILAMGLAGVGSSLGILASGTAAAGAWTKDSKAGKGLAFTYIILTAMPMSQTFYGFILMSKMQALPASAIAANAGLLLAMGLLGGLGEMISAWGQGKIGAAGCRCLSESDGKGFAFLVINMGIIETIGILTMVLMLVVLGNVKG